MTRPTRTELFRWLVSEQVDADELARACVKEGMPEAASRNAYRARMMSAAADIVDPVRTMEARR